MTVKYVLSFKSDELPEIKKISLPIKKGQDITLGVEINAGGFNSSLYKELSTVEFPYILLLDLTRVDIKEEGSGAQLRKTAEYLLPLLLDQAYTRHLTKKTLFLNSGRDGGSRASALTGYLGEYGLHNLRVIDCGEGSALPEANGHRSVAELKLPSAGEYLNTEEDRWILVHTTLPDINSDYSLLSEKAEKYRNSDINILKQDQYTSLQVENRQLQDTIDILKKNIFDLNNYYRYVRGETMFKHHNRDEQKEEKSPSVQQSNQAVKGFFPADQSEKGKYKAYYDATYETLPAIYKKMAIIINILSGRRELLYYLSKKHKKAFLEFVRSLPEEKQVQMWYYYEYEILPGWYKKLGKILAKR